MHFTVCTLLPFFYLWCKSLNFERKRSRKATCRARLSNLRARLSNRTDAFCQFVRATWSRCQGIENTPRNKVFSNMWEGRDPHIFPCPSFGAWIAQFLGGTPGWAGVTITKFFTIKPPLFLWLFWVWESLRAEWECFWTRSEVHTSLVCYPNMPSVAFRR